MKKTVRWNSTKIKLLSLFLALCTVFMLPVGFSSQAAVLPEFGTEIDYGRGAFSAEIQGSAVCYDSEGNAEFCYGVQGGWFYAIDPINGKIKFKSKIPNTTQLISLITASDGNVYFNNYPDNNLKRYNPKTKEIVSLNGFDRNDGSVRVQYAYGNKLYFGVYHSSGGRVYEYDILTDTTRDYGVMKEGAHYVQGVAADENYIYAGIGTSSDEQPNVHAIIRCNKETGQKEELVGPRQGISHFKDLEIVNDKLFAYVNGGILVYNKSTGEQLGLLLRTQPPSSVHPEDSTKIYALKDTHLYEHNTATLASKYGANVLESAEEIAGLKWAKVNGEWVLEFHTPFFSHIGYYNPATKKATVNLVSDIPTEDAGPYINGLEISEDDILYIGGYQTSMSAYDTIEEKFIYQIPNWTQNEGVGFMNGKVYFGTYTDAVIYRYDPQKPINYVPYKYDEQYQGLNVNPTMVFDIEKKQDRPCILEPYNNKLYIGSCSAYSALGGALTIYEEEADGTPSAQVYRNVIPDQSICGIAVKDNLVYLSGTIRGGLGITPTETHAKMAVFNTNTNEIAVEAFVPELPVEGSTTIGELSFGPDGLLWGISEKEGLVFAMDPDTFEVKKSVKTRPGDDREARVRPFFLRWGKDGLLYTNAGWKISVIDPETMQYKILSQHSASLMTLDRDGNIWYARGNNFYKIPKKQTDDILHVRFDQGKQQFVISGTLLKTGINTVAITAPDSTTVMYDEFEAKASEKFIKKYAVDPVQNGTYTVSINNTHWKEPYVTTIVAEVPVDTLRAESYLEVTDTVCGSVQISNFYAQKKTISLFVAGYQNVNGKEKMVGIQKLTKDILPGTYDVLEITMAKEENVDSYKVFAWDEHLTPIVSEKEVR